MPFALFLGHAYDGNRLAVRERHLDTIDLLVATALVERDAGQRRSHLEPPKARSARRMFATFQQERTQAAARPVWVHEECADLRRIDGGIKQVVLAVRPSVTAEERLALAPAPAGDDLALDLDHEIRPVVDQGRIDAEDGLKRTLDLQLGIIVALQLAHRALDHL